MRSADLANTKPEGQMTRPVNELNLRVVVFQEGDLWVAQCLEYDICAQAKDVKTLERRIGRVVRLENERSLSQGKTPFDGIKPAPTHFHAKWAERTSLSGAPKHNERLEFALCA